MNGRPQLTKVLVTGGCGFIGSHFIRLLLRLHPEVAVTNVDKLTYAGNPGNLSDVVQAHGHNANALEYPRYRFVHGDICDRHLIGQLLEQEHVHAIVHFAAETHVDRSIEDSTAFVRTNVLGTQILLEAARSAWESEVPVYGGRNRHHRFLYISTDEVYGPSLAVQKFSEASPLRPTSPYAASKASGDMLCQSYAATYSMPIVIARLSNQYGPNQLQEKLIPKAISSLMCGHSIPIYARGQEYRSWLFVEDACQALEQLLTQEIEHGAYNVPGFGERRNIDLIQEIVRTFDCQTRRVGSSHIGATRFHFVKNPRGAAHDVGYKMKGDKIESEIGWTPSTSIEEGLRRTISWYLRNCE